MTWITTFPGTRTQRGQPWKRNILITDFCNWYLHKDDKLREDINEFVEETNKFWMFRSRNEAREELHKINAEMIQEEMDEDLQLCSHTLPSGTTIMWAGEDEFHPIKKQTRRDQLKDVLRLIQYNNDIETLKRLNREKPSNSKRAEIARTIHEVKEWLDEEV